MIELMAFPEKGGQVVRTALTLAMSTAWVCTRHRA